MSNGKDWVSSEKPWIWGGSHPELQEGEVFLTNVYNEHPGQSDPSFEAISWKTKRRGRTAYDMGGHSVSGLRPVFVARQELVDAGVDVPATRRTP